MPRRTFSTDIEDVNGVVLGYDPPRRLVLINVLGERAAAARNAAGWNVCLAALQADPDTVLVDDTPWRAYYDTYLAEGMPSGAPFPGA